MSVNFNQIIKTETSLKTAIFVSLFKSGDKHCIGITPVALPPNVF